MMHWGWGGYGMGFGMILWWIVVAGLIVLAINGLTNLFSRGKSNKIGMSNSNNALDILNERYVKGEINEEEYEHKKKILLK